MLLAAHPLAPGTTLRRHLPARGDARTAAPLRSRPGSRSTEGAAFLYVPRARTGKWLLISNTMFRDLVVWSTQLQCDCSGMCKPIVQYRLCVRHMLSSLWNEIALRMFYKDTVTWRILFGAY